MFRLTTLRLTGWYLLILVTLSIIFSLVIYNVAYDEVETRLGRFQSGIQLSNDLPPSIISANSLRDSELTQAKTNLSIVLLYVNLIVLVVGGFISYFLARRNLLPIEKAHEAQSRFTSDASHELRTPLAAMKTEIEVALRDKFSDVTSLKETLSSNLEEIDKLSKLAEMLLNLSRLDNTKLQLSPVNLSRLIKKIIKDFNLSASRITISSKKQLIVHGNEMALTDLVKILIDNALQYSPNKSLISVKVFQQDNQAILEITNTGPGIQPDKLPHIFDRFYRADSSRTDGANKGFGLGLALAKNIVELHNGEIFANSNPGHETTFTVSLNIYSILQAKPKL